MAINNSISKQTIFIVVTFICITASLGAYYYSYIQVRETDLSKRNLRLLARLGNQINTIIDGVTEVKNNDIKYYIEYLNKSNNSNTDSLKKRIITLMDIKIPMDSISVAKLPTIEFNKKSITQHLSSNKDNSSIYTTSYQEKITVDSVSTSKLVRKEYTKKPGTMDSSNNSDSTSIYFTAYNGEISIVYKLIINGFAINLYLAARLDRYIDDIDKEEIFDDIFLANSKSGRVVQDTKTPLTLVNIDSLQAVSGKMIPFNKMTGSDASGLINIAGGEFRLFVHPLPKADSYIMVDTSFQNDRWVICGAISKEKFASESKEISKNALVLFLVIIPLCVFAWPLLKYRMARRSTRFKTTDVFFTILVTVFATAFFTIAFLDILSGITLTRDIDSQLKNMAEEISNNFRNEMREACRQLNIVDVKYKQFEDKNIDSVKIQSDSINDNNTYLNIEDIFWCDTTGKQKFRTRFKNSTLTTHPTNSFADRDYFSNVNRGRMWYLESYGKQQGYSIQPLISRSTGDFSASLAIPSKNKKDKIDVAVMDFKPISLVGVVVPRAYNFAIINSDGDVLFHSKPDRNLEENLFYECENSAMMELRARINARAGGSFDSDYWGKSNRFYLEPLKGTSWFIVTFYENDFLQSTNLEMISVPALLFFIYILPFVVSLIYFLFRGHKFKWVWPQVDKPEIYKKLIICYFIIAITLLILIVFFPLEEITLFSAMFIPHLGIIVSYLAFNNSFTSDSLKKVFEKKLLVKYQVSKPKVLLLANFIVILVIFAIIRKDWWSNFCNLWPFMAGLIICFISSYLFLFSHSNFIARFVTASLKPFKEFNSLYLAAILFLFIIGVIIPSIAFFKLGYKTQLKL